MKDPEMMVINTATNSSSNTTTTKDVVVSGSGGSNNKGPNINILPRKKTNASNNSVETTERCSTDGTDPMYITTTTNNSNNNYHRHSPHHHITGATTTTATATAKHTTTPSGLRSSSTTSTPSLPLPTLPRTTNTNNNKNNNTYSNTIKSGSNNPIVTIQSITTTTPNTSIGRTTNTTTTASNINSTIGVPSFSSPEMSSAIVIDNNNNNSNNNAITTNKNHNNNQRTTSPAHTMNSTTSSIGSSTAGGGSSSNFIPNNNTNKTTNTTMNRSTSSAPLPRNTTTTTNTNKSITTSIKNRPPLATTTATATGGNAALSSSSRSIGNNTTSSNSNVLMIPRHPEVSAPATTGIATTSAALLSANKDTHKRGSSLPPARRHTTTSIPKTLDPQQVQVQQQQVQQRRNRVTTNTSPIEQEQMLFEQRIMDDILGLAIRKINQYGKSNLRYVKCITVIEHNSNNNNMNNNNTVIGNINHHTVSHQAMSTTSTTGSGASSSYRSVGNPWNVGRRSSSSANTIAAVPSVSSSATTQTKSYQALTWGKKKEVQIPLRLFIAVRKGKTTDRARRCTSVPANRIVSVITSDPYHPSLDIEAPTTLDRDKFARAFARFLCVPLQEEDKTIITPSTILSNTNTNSTATAVPLLSSSHFVPIVNNSNNTNNNNSTTLSNLEKVPMLMTDQQQNDSIQHHGMNNTTTIISMEQSQQQHQPMEIFASSPFKELPMMTMTTQNNQNNSKVSDVNIDVHNNNNNTFDLYESNHSTTHRESSETDHNDGGSYTQEDIIVREAAAAGVITTTNYNNTNTNNNNNAIVSVIPDIEKDIDDENRSHMSSLTGHGYDQELVEELHNALNELRAELEESRAEASRAVKVAEQAIQSAEKSNSIEWQNTVTHKAAEAAALAQKRSAAAMAKQRLAEERLEQERRAASFWRKQAEIAEEEAGTLQTRAAAAEVHRAAIQELLDHERRIASEQIATLRGRFTSTDLSQRDALEAALERNRALELELDATRRDLLSKQNEMMLVVESQTDDDNNKNRKLKRNFGRKKKGTGSSDGNDSTSLLSDNILSSSSALMSLDQSENRLPSSNLFADGILSAEQVLKVHAETQLMRQQFEMLKRATSDHLEQLPDNVRIWGQQISESLHKSQAEVARLQAKLAMESASRRKLLHEVQDLRGAIRVYCRPKPSVQCDELITLPSHDTIVFNRDNFDDEHGPVSFEFDRVFDPNNSKQQDVYAEVQDVCLGVLDGYNICLMAYGPANCGKTATIFGDIEMSNNLETIQIKNYGIHLQAMSQLFTIANHRSERYKDIFTLTIIEVHNERIRDLIAATETGSRYGHVMIAENKNNTNSNNSTTNRRPKVSTQDADDASSGRPSKLEIRTDIHGDTVIQGLVAVEVKCLEDVISLWQECIAVKARRLQEQGMDMKQYDASNHIIATLRVKSSNIATGIGTIGKIQFVDLAAADIIPRSKGVTTTPQDSTIDNTNVVPAVTTFMHQNDWRFANRSLETFSECIEARMQFERNVPYRNSTLTHLLRDSLESDTKVLLFACVSSDPSNVEETVAVLKFATQLRRVIIGKATKHTLNT